MTEPHGRGAIGWALAGYGSGGRVFHAPLIAAAAGMRLAAVVTGSPERIAQVRRDLPGTRAVPDLGSLAGMGVAGVTISTPPATHAKLARSALRSGLDVVLDKPFALTAAEAAGLVATAREAGRLLVPYFNRRWDGDFLTLRRIVEDGRLGTVHRFTSRLDRCRPVKHGWPSDPAAGGGTLLDLGPHLIDQAVQVLGAVVAVYAELDVRREAAQGTAAAGGPGAEDDVVLHLRHASGARSTLVASLASPAAGPRFLLQGSAGGLRIEGFDIQEAQLKRGASPATLGEGWGVDGDRSALLAGVDGAATSVPLERGRWDAFYPAVAVADTTRVGGTPATPGPVDPADAVAVARVIDAARESAAAGRAVTLHRERHDCEQSPCDAD